MKKIYIVGSINMDLTIESPYMPKTGETITGKDFRTIPGGKGANQAIAAARLGGDVSMCGCVGDDSFGREMLNNLKKESINTNFVKTKKDVSSGIAIIIVSSGDNRIILDKGANATLEKDDIASFLENAKEGDLYLTQLENPIDVIGEGLKLAKEKGLFTILNPAPANKEISKYYKYVDLIVPNETELETLGGKETLFSKGIKTIVTTLGSKGYEIATKEGSKTYPCLKVNAIDTTAAGDTLCGGMVASLSLGKDLIDALAYGSLAASIACTRRGASSSIPKKEELEKYTH